MDDSAQSATTAVDGAIASDADQANGLSRRSFLATGAAAGVGSQLLGPLGKGAAALADGDSFRTYEGRRSDPSVPRGGGAPRGRSVAAVQRARRHPGQPGPRRQRQPAVRDRTGSSRRRHAAVHPRQHPRRDLPLHVPQRLPTVARRRASGPRSVPPPAEQQSDRRAANRAAHQPDGAHRRHELVDPYRSSTKNPDFGDTFPQAVPGLANGKFPAIPRNDADLEPEKHIQAIANTAGFHFGDHRAGRHEPLPVARPASHRPRGAARPAEHRAHRGDALPDLARQGRQRAAADGPDKRAGVPGPERPAVRWRRIQDEPDHAGADDLPEAKPPGLSRSFVRRTPRVRRWARWKRSPTTDCSSASQKKFLTP